MRITEAARNVAGMAAIGAFFIGAGLVVLAVGACVPVAYAGLRVVEAAQLARGWRA